MESNKQQTAVDWLFLMLNNPKTDQEFAHKLLQKAKEIEKEREHELKQLWFGRGILAAKEDRISELKPKKEQ